MTNDELDEINELDCNLGNAFFELNKITKDKYVALHDDKHFKNILKAIDTLNEELKYFQKYI
ncbi:hypothetical protein [Lysinibacillus sphaericus]|uniref:Uncharacterized protein n=1 Tax=Lysinibacillus sphaericus OT4b.31 TaxID=1285586 RepID=R7Z7M7_LYSSH|nr:hypothetical protein [Lysinibacillus sphaericus]EON70180.1 hypothetical protein H131_22726 [Lysinibacillus sphaericus OT4b.31]